MKAVKGAVITFGAVVLSGLIAWGAWVTVGVAGAATNKRVNTIQQRIEDKLDRIQETLIDIAKGD